MEVIEHGLLLFFCALFYFRPESFQDQFRYALTRGLGFSVSGNVSPWPRMAAGAHGQPETADCGAPPFRVEVEANCERRVCSGFKWCGKAQREKEIPDFAIGRHTPAGLWTHVDS